MQAIPRPDSEIITAASAPIAAPTNPAGDSSLNTIIVPQVRDRWLGLVARNYTPDSVRAVLDGTNYSQVFHLFGMFELMEETWPRLAKNLQEVRGAVSRMNWQVVPYAKKGEKPTDEAIEKAKFVEEQIWEMRSDPVFGRCGFTDMVFDLMDAYGKGLTVLEIDWVRKPSGIVGPLGTRWLRPVFYDYANKLEQADRLMLSKTGNAATDLTDFPKHKFIIGLYRWRSAALGTKVGLMRTLAPWWVYSTFATEWMMQFAQIFGIPIRWANYTTPSALSDIKAMLAQMGAAGWGAFPQGTELNIDRTSQSANDAPQGWLMRYTDTLADLAVLGQSLTSEVGSSGGNRALGEVHERVFAGRLNQASSWVGMTLTDQLSRPCIIENYGDDREVPIIMAKTDDPKDPKALAERDKVLFFDMGIPVAKDYIYNTHGIPAPDDNDDLYEKPKPEPIQTTGAPRPGQPRRPGAGERAFSAREELADYNVPEDVVMALESQPEHVAAYYVERIKASGMPNDVDQSNKRQRARHKAGQKGGGRFMAKRLENAKKATEQIMAQWPAEGQHRSRRCIKAFGLSDDTAYFRAFMFPGMNDKVDDAARRAKKTEFVEFKGLRTTQPSVDCEKVMAMIDSTADSTDVLKAPVVVKRGRQKWLWDGHHRAAKEKLLGSAGIVARVVDLDNDHDGEGK